MPSANSKTRAPSWVVAAIALGLATPSGATTWFLDTTLAGNVRADVTGAIKSSYNTSSVEFLAANSTFTFTKMSPLSFSVQFWSPNPIPVSSRMIVFLSGTTRLAALQYSGGTFGYFPEEGRDPWLSSFGGIYTDATSSGGLPLPINQTREQQVSGDYVLPEFGLPQGLTATLRFDGGGPGPAPGVPEPASWAMLITGFGLIGAAMRRRAPRYAIKEA